MVALSDLFWLVTSTYNWCCSSSVDQSQNSSVASSSAATIAVQTCQQLQQSLGPTIVQTSTSGSDYILGANGAWSTFNTEVNYQPTCIVFANEAEHVQTAMKTIYQNEADYAVQAGGHSGMTGWNTIQDGVLISFKNMNTSSYDPDHDTITMLPGVRWGEVITEMEPFGVAPVGGRISEVGTGLLLGGGLSFLSSAEGYASDNYVSLDIVLVDGTLVTATADNEYQDLFKALKGGANRFGIVTRYEVKAVHTGTKEEKRWWGGLFVYPNSSSEALLGAIAHYTHDTNDTNAVMVTVIMTTWPNLEPSISVLLVYNGTETSFNNAFAEFLSIPYTSSSPGSLSFLELSNAVHFPSGMGTLFSASSLAGTPANSDVSVDDYLELYRQYNNFSSAFASSPDIGFTLLDFSPVLQSQIRAGYKKGGNPINPPLGTTGYSIILFQVTYREGVTQTAEDVEDGRQFWIDNAPSTPGLPLFLSEADAAQQVFATYGEYDFLKQVYAKYDPTGFNVRHTEGPLGLESVLAPSICEPLSIFNYSLPLPLCF
ncbi:uncharacterized protein C8R40DRAFT_1164677 [Lentinula edodes]|uniref:uncharacterized protein n=1 Tax=Lentinula edodes TaxID=5353 RepID=UPI001E8E8417|nr:uncharacterized protein C8R40DRAFT_1164677 [Lentinula edodes]KAH7881274.1 hypothetical protein C8R40DRAFT_1164677 [Lentinula edodes]